MVMLLASQAGDQAGGEWLDGEKELHLHTMHPLICRVKFTSLKNTGQRILSEG